MRAHPAYLRDTLLRMAAAELYRPLWTTAILDELVANLPDRVTPAGADRIRSNMVTNFPDALVSGHEDPIDAMTNHPKDRHVLAAAVHAASSAIVTFNLDDFPAEATAPYHVEVLHPDEFLLNQLDLSPGVALEVLRLLAEDTRQRPASDERRDHACPVVTTRGTTADSQPPAIASVRPVSCARY